MLDLARRLGRACVREGELLAELRTEPIVARVIKSLEDAVSGIDPRSFEQPSPQEGFLHLLDASELAGTFELASAQHPIEHLAFLRGLCRGALPRFFTQVEGKVPLEDGTPLPFATRPIHKLYKGDVTPHPSTLMKRHALDGLGFDLFRGAADDPARVILDYRHRDRIDALTWSEGERLPQIATLHPFLGADALKYSTSGSRFFDVGPKQWTLQTVLAQLKGVQAQIAVLPELCLPTADALEAALKAAPAEYPQLIVAGSAHVREHNGAKEVRVNESRIYLDGERVASHRKIRPLVTQKLGDVRFPERLSEDLTGEPKEIVVLSGEHTRLAVVICADLNDKRIPRLLEDAGVNLLLVPALTYSPGAFTGAIAGLASTCQGVSVVVNAELDPATSANGHKQPPFLALVAVPRPGPKDQLRHYELDRLAPWPPRAIIDPNVALGAAPRWI